MTKQQNTALDPDDDSIVFGAEVRRGLGSIVDRTLRNWVARGNFPPPDGAVSGQNFWRRSTYLKAKARLLAGEFAGPGRHPPGQPPKQPRTRDASRVERGVRVERGQVNGRESAADAPASDVKSVA